MAKNPEFWKERLNLFVSIAPVVYVDHTESPLLKWICGQGNRIESRFERIGLFELFGKGWETEYGWLRRLFPIAQRIKINSDMISIDLDDEQRVSQLMGHFPHGTSMRSLTHFGQLIKNIDFTEYDYKKQGNL
jgi:hypothetical protein